MIVLGGLSGEVPQKAHSGTVGKTAPLLNGVISSSTLTGALLFDQYTLCLTPSPKDELVFDRTCVNPKSSETQSRSG